MVAPKRKTAAKVGAAKKRTPTRRASTKKTTAAKAPARKKTVGALLVSVFGPFNSRVLVEMPSKMADELFAELGEAPKSRSRVIDAVEQELVALVKRAPNLADEQQLAATAVALAYELEHPYNSATSKSMCARALNETMDRLREMAPAKPEADGIDELNQKRDQRRRRVARASGASAPVRS